MSHDSANVVSQSRVFAARVRRFGPVLGNGYVPASVSQQPLATGVSQACRP
jgi:hypothetical protein